jgi:hypothetical protein
MKPFRIPFIALALGIALIFAFLLAGPVFAQDELPPAPEETPVAELAPAAEEAAPADAPAPVEEPLAVEEPPAVVVEEAAPPVEEPPVETAPEIVALDEGGAVLPLASAAAAETVTTGDPYFKDGAIYRGWSDTGICPAIVTVGYCTPSAPGAALSDAITAYGGLPTATGPIYLEADTYNFASDLTINGSIANYADLTGLIGTGSAGVTLNFANNFHMIIQNMPAGFTLQGMTIIGNDTGSLVEFSNIAGNLVLTDVDINNTLDTDSDGLSINGVTGNVTLNTIKANGNYDEGAYITSVTGKVTVTNSSFDDNGAFGVGTGKHSLYIKSTGAISLNGVSASDFNRGNGAYLKSLGGITVKNSLFNYNNDNNTGDSFGYGLRIDPDTKGAILLDHVTTNYNQMAGIKVDTTVGGAVTMTTVEAVNNVRTGIEIDNCGGGAPCTTTTGAVNLTNLTLNNRYGNLRVIANGAITLNNVMATNAYANGLIDTGFGGINLDNSNAKVVSAVTVNNATANQNNYAGFLIRSKGAVTLNHVTASSNSYGNAVGIDIVTNGAVTFLSTLGENYVYNNNSYGVTIITGGAVSISKLTSTDNDLTNLQINNTSGSGGVTITTGNFGSSNGGSGLRVLSDGAITLTDVDATNNVQDGIYLDNSTGTGAGVTIKATGVNENSVRNSLGDYGLYVLSRGTISVSRIDTSYNDSRVELNNAFSGVSAGVTVNGIDAYSVNDISDEAAVRIYSNGAVSVNDLEVTYALDKGLYIDNQSSGKPGITLSNINITNNSGGGLILFTNGAVKITNIYSEYQTSGGFGAEIHAGGAVTIDKTSGANNNRFRNNPGNGLVIYAAGAVTIKDTSVINNIGFGAYVEGATTATVTNSYFNNNSGGTGLSINASGVITVTGSSASSNSGRGMELSNSSGTAGVTVTGGPSGWVSFETNGTGNLRIVTNGPLTLSNLVSNTSVDALLVPNTVGNVTISNADFSNTSGGTTLAINSNGSVTMTNVTTHSASGNGLVIDNHWSAGKTVSITDFYDNSTTGTYAMQIVSAGVVTLKDIDVDGGGLRDYGIWVNNALGTKTGVTMSTSSIYIDNQVTNFQMEGIHIQSSGQVTLDELDLSDNPWGLYVDTDGGVTVTDSTVADQSDGIQIFAGGAVVLTNNYARAGAGKGVFIDNSSATTAAPVTITKLWVNDNDYGGLQILSTGAVTITNLYAGSQDVSGYALEIDTDGAVTMNAAGLSYWEWNDLSNGSGSVSGGIIHAGGNITLTGIYASYNAGGSGLTVDSDNGTVTIKNAWFNNNGVNGLSVTAAGAISLTNVSARYNVAGHGAMLDNLAGGTGGITIMGSASNYNSFSNNDTIGLDLATQGAVGISYITADENPLGIRFPTPGNRVGNVTMNGVTVINNSTPSTGYGLLFESVGTVSLTNIDVSNNLLGGVKIDNSFASTPKTVTLTDIYATGTAGDYGLYVRSKGAITAKYLQVDGNLGRQYGIWLDNDETGASGGVTISPSATGYWGYAMDMTNIGLNIESKGAVSVNGYSIYNNLAGVRIQNQAGGVGTGAVTVSNVDSYSNDQEGILIRTNGNTTLTNLDVYSNGSVAWNGIDIEVGEVTPGGFSGTVTLTGLYLTENKNHEIKVVSHKQITAKDIYAYDSSGADIGSAVYFETEGGVSILDPARKDYDGYPIYNQFYGELDVVNINAGGDVILQRVSAYGSFSGNGIQVVTSGKVTLTNTYAESNNDLGIYIDTAGAISLTGVTAQYNGGTGAMLNNSHPGSTAGVTVATSLFYNNYGVSPNAGLMIQSNGAVLLNQVEATSNNAYGAYITIPNPSTAAVTVNKSVFNYNDADGLYVQNRGNITVNGITASDNWNTNTNGVTLDNSSGTGTVSVLATMGANTFFNNYQHGLAIRSSNAVVINNVTASESYIGVGIGVDTTTAAAGFGKVTITGATTNQNGGNGISINSNGLVTITSVYTLMNGLSAAGYTGIDISTTSGYSVLVQNSVVSGNGKEGIRANPGALQTLTVKNTFYMGHARWAVANNLVAVTGTLVVIP